MAKAVKTVAPPIEEALEEKLEQVSTKDEQAEEIKPLAMSLAELKKSSPVRPEPEPKQEWEKEAKPRELTFGEKAVGLTFNPGSNPLVHGLKTIFAGVIDDLNDQKQIAISGEVKRMYSIAITEVQTAQMWSVKAATWVD